ncbi:MAG: hypothetical protein ABSH42_03480 [Bryobacteraceae bacterium]
MTTGPTDVSGTSGAATAAGGAIPGPRRRPRFALSRTDWLVLLAVAIVCGLAAFIGVPVLREFGHDLFSVLGSSYRVNRGQIPHRDFPSAFGPVFYLIVAGGLALSGLRPAGIGYANAVFGAVIGLWTYGIVRGRVAAAGALLLAVYAALLIAAPFALGYNPLAFTYGMLYNRYGYGLLGVIVVECGLQALRRPEAEGPGIGRGFSAGVAWALLVFLKISYGVAAAPFLLLWVCCGTGRRRRVLALCGGFGATAVIVLGYLRFDLADMFRDLTYAASGRAASWRPAYMLRPVVVMESIPLLLLAVLLTAGTGEAAFPWRRLRVWWFVLAAIGVGGLLLTTNHQAMSLPLDGFAAVLLVDAVVRREARGSRSRWLPAMFLGTLCLLPLTAMSGVSLTAAAWERYRGQEAPPVRVRSARGASLVFAPVLANLTTETGGPAYAETLNDGMDLIRTHAAPGEGVLAIDQFNPFNYLLDRPTPRGGMAIATYYMAFTETAHPSDDRYFGDARWALVRKYSRTAQDFPIEDFEIHGLVKTYQPGLEQRFRLVEETGHWSLWRRK